MHFSLFFFERRTSFVRLIDRFYLLVLRLRKWAFIHATFCWKSGGVCLLCVSVHCHVGWSLFDMWSSLKAFVGGKKFPIRCFSCYVMFFVLCRIKIVFSVLFTYFYGFIYSIQLCVVATWVVGWSWCLKCSFSIICTRMLLIAVRLTFRAVFANADYTKLVLKLYVWKNKAHWNIKKNLKKKKGWSEHVQVVYYRIGFIFWGLL